MSSDQLPYGPPADQEPPELPLADCETKEPLPLGRMFGSCTLAYVLVQVGLAILASLVGAPYLLTVLIASGGSVLAIFAVLILWYNVLERRVSISTMLTLGQADSRDLSDGAVTGFVCLMAVIAITIPMNLILHHFGQEVPPHDFIKLLSGGPFAVVGVYVAAVVIAPIGEEILFRRLLYCGLDQRIGPIGAMWVTCLVFAVIHTKLTHLLPLAVVAFLLQKLYLRKRNLFSCMVAHAVFNGCQLTMALLFLEHGAAQ